MKVSRLHGDRDLRLHEEPMPVPQDGEALVRVTAVGICGSDLHEYTAGPIFIPCVGNPSAGGGSLLRLAG